MNIKKYIAELKRRNVFKAGLAYEADMEVNWCPILKTVIANEEVIDGKCERSGAKVEKKKVRQWQKQSVPEFVTGLIAFSA